ncbi:MAG: tetraacyldisaccharide 4'-kinase [Bacteroidales bacterium]|nr:tetraacyldisaccharide 4'-kinase [Bacteroidales bacterium]
MSKPLKVRRILYPLAWIFGGAAWLRRFMYSRGILKSYKPEIPVVCVGNIAIGGTGKTPHAEFITRTLSENHHVAMLSRGYGRTSKGYLLANSMPEEQLTAELIGDEPMLLHQRFPNLPLAVDEDRKDGIEKLQTYAPETDVIVMDDAYQHLSVSPILRMILTEYERPYFKDYPLPAGRLREYPSAVRDADLVIVTKVSDEQVDRNLWRKKLGIRNNQPLFFTRYKYGKPEPVTQPAKDLTLDDNSEILLLTGIARSQPLLEHLQKAYHIERHFKFQDHHRYTLSEIESLKKYFKHNSVLFTTEKDWMRLQYSHIKNSLSLLPVFILPIEVEFLTEEENTTFINILEDHVRREKKED